MAAAVLAKFGETPQGHAAERLSGATASEDAAGTSLWRDIAPRLVGLTETVTMQ